MSHFRLTAALLLGLAAACTPVPVDPEDAARECEARARAAQGPTGTVTAGVNSQTGGFAGIEIGVTSDFLLGADPLEVYSECVWNLTGQAPFRPPEL